MEKLIQLKNFLRLLWQTIHSEPVNIFLATMIADEEFKDSSWDIRDAKSYTDYKLFVDDIEVEIYEYGKDNVFVYHEGTDADDDIDIIIPEDRYTVKTDIITLAQWNRLKRIAGKIRAVKNKLDIILKRNKVK